ncbi:MAG TPA: 3-oxoacyl-ACP synthase [Mucilaginibacter sp.]
MTNLKKDLYTLCVNYVKARIENAKQAIQDAQQSADEETKSSAGDKYETGREMMQQETDRNQAQLNEANKLLIALNQINIDSSSSSAAPGSLVITDNGKFYLSISAGALNLNGEGYFAVSPASPIGTKLLGRKTGDEFNLNGKYYKVKEVV